ncbi:DUF397 domain-containing protein [Kitasatospora sp. NPDC001309]|uniref:DUF397 domain-containing protein n=1 Tax=Kitasatospora sp. NPDC001309 TaxID=3364013 RepID=UPI0036A229A4
MYIINDASTLNVEWTKGRTSGPDDNCGQFAKGPDSGVYFSHSKAPNGPAFYLNAGEWEAMKAGFRDGDFENL